jgi:hypothetical protein
MATRKPPIPPPSKARKKVRTFSATDEEVHMLEALAAYHGFSKSAMLTSLVKMEFWRVFPAGTAIVKPHAHARVKPAGPKEEEPS